MIGKLLPGTFIVMVVAIFGDSMPASAGQATVFKGSVTVHAPGVIEGSDVARLPRVRVGIAQVEVALFNAVWGYADSNGDFELAFDYEDQKMVDVALIVVLEDEEGLLEVTDLPAGQPACMISKPFTTDTGIVVESDFKAEIAISNDTQYSAFAQKFEPTMQRCNGEEVSSVRFDPKNGVSNVFPDEFAHLAAMYVWAYDAARYATDVLGESPPKVTVKAFNALAANFSYQCDLKEIAIANQLSLFDPTVKGYDPENSMFAMRHEYGHHVHCTSSMSGNDDLGDPPSAGNHAGVFNDSSGDSLAEGFAHYYAASVSQHVGESRPDIVMLPLGPVHLEHGGEVVDHPDAPGFNMTSGRAGEELAIASLLWQIGSETGETVLWDVLANGSPSIENVKNLRDAMLANPTTSAVYNSFCTFATGAQAFGSDCLFVDRGFYHDFNADGLFDDGEIVGETRFPTEERAETEFRPNTPSIPGSDLLVSTVDEQGSVVADSTLQLSIVFDPPAPPGRFDYSIQLDGPGPHEVPVHVPGNPSRLTVRAAKDGIGVSDSIEITSDFYHDAVNPFRDGGVGTHLLEAKLELKPVSSPAPSPEIVNQHLALSGDPDTHYDEQGGTFSIDVEFRNVGTTALHDMYFEIVVLDGPGCPCVVAGFGGEGARIQVDSAGNELGPGGTFAASFAIELSQRAPFDFAVDVWGTVK